MMRTVRYVPLCFRCHVSPPRFTFSALSFKATLLNLLLRNYIHFNLLDQADKLIAKTTFPESAGNNQFARYYYYLGQLSCTIIRSPLDNDLNTNSYFARRQDPRHPA